MYINYTDKPRGVLRRATGLSDTVLNLNPRTKEDLLASTGFISFLQKEALRKPGKTIRQYHEENGYEYEERVTYDETLNIFITNNIQCPLSCHHHIGSTCGMCGLKD